jgi:hypothetical protein
VTAETRTLMRDLPLQTVWLDGIVIEDLINAVESVRGMEAVRIVTRKGQMAIVPVLRPIIGGLLRLFGASPATLFSRLHQFSSNHTRGPELTWKPESDHAGELHVTFPHRKNASRNMFVGFESGMHNIFELCDKEGTVEEARILGATGIIRAHWT